MTIWVDGDACPVKAEVEQVASRVKVPVKIVCNGGLRPSANPLVEVVYVSEGLDVADDFIAENAGKGDVVVTADIPLAARCVEAGALVVKPDGERLTSRNMGAALATRDLMTDLRAANPLKQGGGAKPFSKADRARFVDGLDRALRAAAR
ncbi:YaiI/YqxD family protein [Oceanicola sp. D3]|uniref:YaiI/YqxD family protein n=1 Tax=Oceanicola sp. D3 TaxID=2587163 RepID=UPI00112456EC|nr:YaiI/YqxD family protein [Oceanicola sp. D3]QDC08662.1 YaiI/YqxD family protein [Oceanicola sp. D3]